MKTAKISLRRLFLVNNALYVILMPVYAAVVTYNKPLNRYYFMLLLLYLFYLVLYMPFNGLIYRLLKHSKKTDKSVIHNLVLLFAGNSITIIFGNALVSVLLGTPGLFLHPLALLIFMGENVAHILLSYLILLVASLFSRSSISAGDL